MPASNSAMFKPATRISSSKLESGADTIRGMREAKAQRSAAKNYWEYNQTIDPNADPGKAPSDWKDKAQVKAWKKSGKHELPERKPKQSGFDSFKERTAARIQQRRDKAAGLWHDPMEYRLGATSTNEGEIAQQVEGHMHRRLFGSGRQEFVHDYDPRTGEKMDTGSYQFVGNKNDVESEKHRDLSVNVQNPEGGVEPWYTQQERYRQQGQAERGAFGTPGYGWVNQGGEPARSGVERQMAAMRGGLNLQGVGQTPQTPQATPQQPKPPKGGGAPPPSAPPSGGGGGAGGSTAPKNPGGPAPQGGTPAPAPGGATPPQPSPGVTPKGGGGGAPTKQPAATGKTKTTKTTSKVKPQPMLTRSGDVSPVQPDRRKKSQLLKEVDATPVTIKNDRRTRASRTAKASYEALERPNEGKGILSFDYTDVQRNGAPQLVTPVGEGKISAPTGAAVKAQQAGHNEQKFRST